MLATQFLTFLWSLIVIFFMVIFFILLFHVIVDLSRGTTRRGGRRPPG